MLRKYRFILPIIGVVAAISLGGAKNQAGTSVTGEVVQIAQPPQLKEAKIKNIPIIEDENLHQPDIQEYEPPKKIVLNSPARPDKNQVNIIHPPSYKKEAEQKIQIAQTKKKQLPKKQITKSIEPKEIRFNIVDLKAHPVLRIEGEQKWDELTKRVESMYKQLQDIATQNNLTIKGQPLMVYLETDENKFTFEFILPIEKIPENEPTLPKGVSFSFSPTGKAYRFTHNGLFKDIEATYGGIAEYLITRKIVTKDIYAEEYLTLPSTNDENNARTAILIFPKS